MRRLLLSSLLIPLTCIGLFPHQAQTQVQRQPLENQPREYKSPTNYEWRDRENQFIVGILRADGILIPFAQYGNGGWWNPWPKPRHPRDSIYAETEVTHHSLSDLKEPWFSQCGKMPRTWYFWSSESTPTVLKASKVVQVQAHSGTNWALLTDLPKRSTEDTLHSQIGIAINVNTKVNPMIQATSSTAEEVNIISFVKQTIGEAETDELNRLRDQRPLPEFPMRQLPLPKEERDKIKTSISKLYRSTALINGEHFYYFEAEKRYPAAQASQSCEYISWYRGWISTQGKGGLGLLDSQLVFTDCDRKGASYSIPLGMMMLNNQMFLFATEHGWEDQSYMILEFDYSGLHRVLDTLGG